LENVGLLFVMPLWWLVVMVTAFVKIVKKRE